MVQPWQLALAVIAGLLMLALILGMSAHARAAAESRRPAHAGHVASSASSVAVARPSSTAAVASATPALTVSQRPAA